MTMTTEPEDKLAHAKAQGQAQFDSIVEMVEALEAAGELEATNENCNAHEDAEQTIQEDALSVEVRSGWHSAGPPTPGDTYEADEYRILLCTGGPAVQIRGTLSEHFEPETAHLEVQDWFTPWTRFWPAIQGHDSHEEILLTYARCFCFGE